MVPESHSQRLEVDIMEAQHQDFWKKFHAEIQREHKTHIVEGAIMAPLMLAGPFVFLWILGMVLGR
jgi:hypothetical protein